MASRAEHKDNRPIEIYRVAMSTPADCPCHPQWVAIDLQEYGFSAERRPISHNIAWLISSVQNTI